MADETNHEELDAQKQYLIAKIDEMADGVAPGYGEAFLEELMGRLERTVSEFNEEVSELLETLKSRSAEREEKLKALLAGGDDAPSESSEEVSAAESEMSDWEKRLESKGGTSPKEPETAAEQTEEPEEEEPEKKGFFKRRKKKKKKKKKK